MQARGFVGPAAHTVRLAGKERVPLLPNMAALLLLPAVVLGAQRLQYLF